MRKSRNQDHKMGKGEAEAAIKRFISKAIKSGRAAHPLLKGISSEFWEDKRNLRRALTLVHIATGKPYGRLQTADFIDRSLTGVVNTYDGVYGAALEAGLADIRPWELHSVRPTFWSRPGFRLDALRWTVERMRKEGKPLSQFLAENRNLSSLFYGYYKSDFNRMRGDAEEAGIKDSELITMSLPNYIGILKTRPIQA